MTPPVAGASLSGATGHQQPSAMSLLQQQIWEMLFVACPAASPSTV